MGGTIRLVFIPRQLQLCREEPHFGIDHVVLRRLRAFGVPAFHISNRG